MIMTMDEPRPAHVPAPAAQDAPSDRPAPRRAQVEQECRGLPVTLAQRAWAICRPFPHRTPRPKVGDEVLYRADSWREPIPARVLWIQPDDDVDDPHVCQVQIDEHGRPTLLDGRPLFVTNPDAWLSLKLSITIDGHIEHPITREARLPGSPGWLPLDWEDRFRPMPWEV
jgi:hypothetical protein